MCLEQRIVAIGRSIERLSERLRNLGYQFQEPTEVFPGPSSDTEAAIKRIEREIGLIPEAIKVFWRLVGSVNFIGAHSDWRASNCPDPIVVFPPEFAIYELDEFLGDREERERHNLPYLLPIAPDALHKDGVSGGMWYNINVPALADDPPLNEEWHGFTFVAYLECAVKWGGFPGLDGDAGHNYPLDEIRCGSSGDG